MPGQRTVSASEAVSDDRAQNRFLRAVAAVAAAGLWIPQLTSSFRMDETATHWLISGDVSDAIERSLEFQGESPFYTLIAYGTKIVFGASELALRIPSMLAMAGAALLVYMLGARLAGREAGLLASIALIASHGMAFAAGDARPYPLAIVAILGSTLALIRWADRGGTWDATLYVLLTAAALYFHYLTFLAFIAHPIYAWTRRNALRPASYSLAVGVVGLLMIPSLPQLVSLFNRREHLEVQLGISVVDLFTVLFPPLLVGGALLSALLVVRRMNGSGIVSKVVAPGGRALILSWWILPPVVLYLVSRLSSTTLFEPRFFFFSTPALALAVGIGMSWLDPPRARRMVVTGVVIAAVLGFGSRTHSGDDWRAAMAAVRALSSSNTPVLLRPQLIEASQVDWLDRPDKVAYLLATLSPYPVRGDIVTMPYALTPESRPYLEDIAAKIEGASQFILVNDYGGFRPWLEGRLPAFESRIVAPGIVSVVLFERTD